MSALCVAGATGVAGDGVFVPRNGGVEGRVGKSHVFLDTSAGGVLELVTGEWPDLKPVTRMEPTFALGVPRAGTTMEVRQGLDHDPEVIFLEEGPERLGIRVRFKLYDAANGYRGHGLSEVWAYPNGEVFVVSAASFEGMALSHVDGGVTVKVRKATGSIQCAVPADPADRLTVTAAGLDFTCADAGSAPVFGRGPETNAALSARSPAFGDAELPGRFVLINPGSDRALGVYWLSGAMRFNNFVYRPEGGSPTYYQWPSFLRQAYYGRTPKRVHAPGKGVRLDWLDDGDDPGPNPEFTAVVRLAAGVSEKTLAALVAVEREPLPLSVEGGAVHGNQGGYNDQEGVYEVRKGAEGEPLRVTIPGSTHRGVARIKVVGLAGHGAVRAMLDGVPVRAQLSAEGGIADDPLAPIREAPEGPADTAVATVPLGAAPRVLELREQPGVQLVYQRKDVWRNVACFTSHGGDRYPAFRFSLRDGVLRNTRAYGQREFALTENLMHWFSYCGFSPEQMLNRLQAFSVKQEGAGDAEFSYVARNATGGAESEYRVSIPDSPAALRLEVAARFTVLGDWPYHSAQFFDVFPFRGVWPKDWWYAEVLWVAPDGRVKWMNTLDRTVGGDTDLVMLEGPGFFALHASDRGNMLMLTRGFEPVLPVRYTICGNYVDFHMDLKFPGPGGKPAPPRRGDTVSMKYELALWGDAKVTRAQLIERGRHSLRLGRLALDE